MTEEELKAREEQLNKRQASIESSAQQSADAKYLQNQQGLTVSGSPEELASAREGLQFGKLLYGQDLPEVGQEAKQYSGMVKGRLDQDYAKADIYRQGANRRLAQQAGKVGMAGASLGGAQEQLYRQSGAEAEAMNQDYKDKALALYGRNISAKQQGIGGAYMGFRGVGQAKTPGPVTQYDSGLSVICTELFAQGKISEYEWSRASVFGYKLSNNTYNGYLIIASPIVKLMKKSDKFSNLFIDWSKSIAKNKPNLLTRILLPICWMVGYVGTIKEEKIARVS